MLGAVANNLVALTHIGGETSNQQAFLYQLLCGLPRRSTLSLKDLVGVILEPEVAGVFEPDTLIKKLEPGSSSRVD
jgi:hypothetical protein